MTRSPRRPWLLIGLFVSLGVVVALFASRALAQATPAAGEKPKFAQIVTVRKADGSTVRGQVLGGDGDRLNLKPVAGNSFGEPIDVAWDDVKSVSNGLTREKLQQAWKAEHKAELCADCDGDRHLPCDVCKGTGHDPASSADCKTCKGELLVECTDKRCEDGKIPCPEPCLKLSQGSWSKPDADGKRWRSFRVKAGTFKVSDGHLGEIHTIKNGEMYQPGACPTCDKTGSIACPTCNGKSKVACPTCKADKKAADCAACERGTQPCATCSGTGLKGKDGATAAPAADAPAPTPAPVPAPAAPPAATPPKKPSDDDGLD